MSCRTFQNQQNFGSFVTELDDLAADSKVISQDPVTGAREASKEGGGRGHKSCRDSVVSRTPRGSVLVRLARVNNVQLKSLNKVHI